MKWYLKDNSPCIKDLTWMLLFCSTVDMVFKLLLFFKMQDQKYQNQGPSYFHLLLHSIWDSQGWGRGHSKDYRFKDREEINWITQVHKMTWWHVDFCLFVFGFRSWAKWLGEKNVEDIQDSLFSYPPMRWHITPAHLSFFFTTAINIFTGPLFYYGFQFLPPWSHSISRWHTNHPKTDSWKSRFAKFLSPLASLQTLMSILLYKTFPQESATSVLHTKSTYARIHFLLLP